MSSTNIDSLTTENDLRYGTAKIDSISSLQFDKMIKSRIYQSQFTLNDQILIAVYRREDYRPIEKTVTVEVNISIGICDDYQSKYIDSLVRLSDMASDNAWLFRMINYDSFVDKDISSTMKEDAMEPDKQYFVTHRNTTTSDSTDNQPPVKKTLRDTKSQFYGLDEFSDNALKEELLVFNESDQATKKSFTNIAFDIWEKPKESKDVCTDPVDIPDTWIKDKLDVDNNECQFTIPSEDDIKDEVDYSVNREEIVETKKEGPDDLIIQDFKMETYTDREYDNKEYCINVEGPCIKDVNITTKKNERLGNKEPRLDTEKLAFESVIEGPHDLIIQDVKLKLNKIDEPYGNTNDDKLKISKEQKERDIKKNENEDEMGLDEDLNNIESGKISSDDRIVQKSKVDTDFVDEFLDDVILLKKSGNTVNKYDSETLSPKYIQDDINDNLKSESLLDYETIIAEDIPFQENIVVEVNKLSSGDKRKPDASDFNKEDVYMPKSTWIGPKMKRTYSRENEEETYEFVPVSVRTEHYESLCRSVSGMHNTLHTKPLKLKLITSDNYSEIIDCKRTTAKESGLCASKENDFGKNYDKSLFIDRVEKFADPAEDNAIFENQCHSLRKKVNELTTSPNDHINTNAEDNEQQSLSVDRLEKFTDVNLHIPKLINHSYISPDEDVTTSCYQTSEDNFNIISTKPLDDKENFPADDYVDQACLSRESETKYIPKPANESSFEKFENFLQRIERNKSYDRQSSDDDIRLPLSRQQSKNKNVIRHGDSIEDIEKMLLEQQKNCQFPNSQSNKFHDRVDKTNPSDDEESASRKSSTNSFSVDTLSVELDAKILANNDPRYAGENITNTSHIQISNEDKQHDSAKSSASSRTLSSSSDEGLQNKSGHCPLSNRHVVLTTSDEELPKDNECKKTTNGENDDQDSETTDDTHSLSNNKTDSSSSDEESENQYTRQRNKINHLDANKKARVTKHLMTKHVVNGSQSSTDEEMENIKNHIPNARININNTTKGTDFSSSCHSSTTLSSTSAEESEHIGKKSNDNLVEDEHDKESNLENESCVRQYSSSSTEEDEHIGFKRTETCDKNEDQRVEARILALSNSSSEERHTNQSQRQCDSDRARGLGNSSDSYSASSNSSESGKNGVVCKVYDTRTDRESRTYFDSSDTQSRLSDEGIIKTAILTKINTCEYQRLSNSEKDTISGQSSSYSDIQLSSTDEESVNVMLKSVDHLVELEKSDGVDSIQLGKGISHASPSNEEPIFNADSTKEHVSSSTSASSATLSSSSDEETEDLKSEIHDTAGKCVDTVKNNDVIDGRQSSTHSMDSLLPEHNTDIKNGEINSNREIVPDCAKFEETGVISLPSSSDMSIGSTSSSYVINKDVDDEQKQRLCSLTLPRIKLHNTVNIKEKSKSLDTSINIHPDHLLDTMDGRSCANVIERKHHQFTETWSRQSPTGHTSTNIMLAPKLKKQFVKRRNKIPRRRYMEPLTTKPRPVPSYMSPVNAFPYIQSDEEFGSSDSVVNDYDSDNNAAEINTRHSSIPDFIKELSSNRLPQSAASAKPPNSKAKIPSRPKVKTFDLDYGAVEDEVDYTCKTTRQGSLTSLTTISSYLDKPILSDKPMRTNLARLESFSASSLSSNSKHDKDQSEGRDGDTNSYSLSTSENSAESDSEPELKDAQPKLLKQPLSNDKNDAIKFNKNNDKNSVPLKLNSTSKNGMPIRSESSTSYSYSEEEL